MPTETDTLKRNKTFVATFKISPELWGLFDDVVVRLKKSGLMHSKVTRSSILQNYIKGFIVDFEGELRRFEVANGSVIKAYQELEEELEEATLRNKD